MQPIIKILIPLAIAYAAILLLVRLFADRLIYFPNYPGRLTGDWHPDGLPIQDTWLRTADGVKLRSWWIPAEGSQFTFLVFHGNAANILPTRQTFIASFAICRQMYLQWSTAATVAVKGDRAKLGSTRTRWQPGNTSYKTVAFHRTGSSHLAHPWVPQ